MRTRAKGTFMQSVVVIAAAGACLLTVGATARGQTGGDGTADKSQYNLLNPTPPGLMRELSADRPDVTESPYTVDAGHAQVELSFFEYSRFRTGPDGEATAVLPVNVKVGLTNNVDLQFVVDPYLRLRGEGTGDAEGFGDTQLRLKVNLWGNDGGDTALALMPFVQFPTGDDGVGADRAEGGLILPFAVGLTDRLALALMAELDVLYDPADDDYFVEFVHTASLGVILTDAVGAYVEYIGIQPSDGGDYVALLGTGLTYGVSEDVQLDVGVNVGLTDDAEEFTVFSGLTFRL